VRVEKVETWEFPLTAPSNYYIVTLDGRTILIDAGAKPLPERLIERLDGVVITHWHWDHTYGIASLRSKTICASKRTIDKLNINNVRASVYRVVEAMGLTMREDPSLSFLEEMIARYNTIIGGLSENEVHPIEDCPFIEKEVIDVLDCPGHSEDHICPLIGEYVFAGDVLTPQESPTIINYNKYIGSIVGMLGISRWSFAAPGHGPILSRSGTIKYINNIIKRKNGKMYKLLAFLGPEWVDFNVLLNRLYGLKPSLAAYVAARTLIGYLAAAEDMGIVEVDRARRPWRIRARA